MIVIRKLKARQKDLKYLIDPVSELDLQKVSGIYIAHFPFTAKAQTAGVLISQQEERK